MRRIRYIACVAVAAALTSPALTSAGPPRPSLPSIDQYIEAIPTSAGPQSAASVAERVQPLARAAEQQVRARAGSDAEALTKIATSSRYGAPVGTAGDPRAARPTEPGDEDEKSALEPIPAQPAESADSRLIALVAFMAASLLAALGYELVRRRSRQPDG